MEHVRGRSMRGRVAVLVAALLALGLMVPGVATAATTTVPASADTTVRADQPTTNFGTSATLSVSASPVIRGFVKFTVTQPTVTRATLRLYSYATSATGLAVYRVADNSWTETGITDATAPTFGSLVANSGALTVNSWAAIDVSSYVTGPGTYSIGLSTTSTTAKQVAARETAASPPQLVLESTPPPAAVAATAGTPQSAVTGAAFATALAAKVTDASGAAVAGAQVTFTTPGSGASATFPGLATTATVATGTDGVATAPALTANATVGSYTATASVAGVSATASYALSNTAGSGPPTGTVTASADATVRADQPTTNYGNDATLSVNGSPVVRGFVKFTVSQASVTKATLRLYSYAASGTGFSVSRVADNSWTETGITNATAPAFGSLVANSGAITVNAWAAIDVSAYVNAPGTYSFGLSTTSTTAKQLASRQTAGTPPQLVIESAAPGTPVTVTPVSGGGQSATTGSAFTTPLAAKVTDSTGAGVAGAQVTFTAPAAEPTATFPGPSASVVAATGSDGVATSPALTAGATTGGYQVTATVPGVSGSATFALTTGASAGPDPVIAAVGDIACTADKTPTATSCQQTAVSDVVVANHPDTVLPLGDEQYETGNLTDFQNAYDPGWGRVKNISKPVPGNHEYGYIGTAITPTGAAGYFAYYGPTSHPQQPDCTTSCTAYYSYDIGTWHLIALDSQCPAITGGCGATSPEANWLRNDLSTHPNTCTLAYWHIPVWASSTDRQPDMQAITQILYDNNTDIILTGHAHYYERFAPQDPNKNPDPTRGIRAFVIGTGGRSFFSISQTPQPNSEARIPGTFGALTMTLHPAGYDWAFHPTTPDGPTDTGTGTCH